MKLIDIDAFRKEHLLSTDCNDCQRNARKCMYNDFSLMDFCGWLDDVPPVDAIKVTRCADCVYWEPENAEEGDTSGRCRNDYAPCQNQPTDMTWFCADGERMETE